MSATWQYKKTWIILPPPLHILIQQKFIDKFPLRKTRNYLKGSCTPRKCYIRLTEASKETRDILSLETLPLTPCRMTMRRSPHSQASTRGGRGFGLCVQHLNSCERTSQKTSYILPVLEVSWSVTVWIPRGEWRWSLWLIRAIGPSPHTAQSLWIKKVQFSAFPRGERTPAYQKEKDRKCWQGCGTPARCW